MEPGPLFSFYLRKSLQDTTFLKPVYIKKKAVKQLSFISLVKLIGIACDEGRNFNLNHVIFFIEPLSNRKYMIRQVKLQYPRIKDD